MARPRAGSKALIRQINEALVLDVARVHGPLSRADIVMRTGLSAATITGISASLISAGFLTESDVLRDTGGRPARLLDLARGGAVAAGVRLTHDEALGVLVDLRGEVMTQARERLRSSSPAAAAGAIARVVEALLRGTAGTSLLGAGVAVSGVVDQEAGRIRHSGAMGWDDVEFQLMLDERLGVPVVIDSFANSVAMGLVLYDPKVAGSDQLVVTVAESLGVATIVGGEVHRGFAGSAGGFAHMTVDLGRTGGPVCHCGALGCLETRSSLWGMRRELARDGLDEDLRSSEAKGVVQAAAHHLAGGIANISKVFGPGRIVVAFAPELDVPVLVEGVRATFEEHYRHEQSPAPELQIESATPEVLARGAAHVLLATLFRAGGAAAASRPPLTGGSRFEEVNG